MRTTIKISIQVITLFLLSLQISQCCDLNVAIEAFSQKIIDNPPPLYTENPYSNSSSEFIQDIINPYLNNKVMVCGLKYTTPDKIHYEIQTFASQQDAEAAGYIVTHQGRCGSCSDVQDLVVYLKQNLTVPVRLCSLKGILSKKWSINCLRDIGFTESCAQIWYYDAMNTKKECFGTCMWEFITGGSFNQKNGDLSTCIACDEDKSGPLFKYYSGRTRRNSGIISAISRPADQIYNMSQCYY